MREHQVRTGDLLGFGIGLLNTAREWLDHAQKALPRYKEPIAGIHLYPDKEKGPST
ncbi:MAG: hypothetical protein M3173_08515 [Chloroflexota bacterium]|nr:hypothetical protein [Chloroflexota bacterium]